MKKHFRRKLSIEGESLNNPLRIKSYLLFILPLIVGAYSFYKGPLQSLNSYQLLVFMFILLLVLSGNFLVRHIFEKFAMVSVS